MLRLALIALVALTLATSAHGSTLYVANNGLDRAGCGPKASPCRSISQAIGTAAAGDTIIVGPGEYGDLDGDGTPGDSPGEEVPAPGCGCMLALNKVVTLVSSDGAAATIIDAHTANVNTNVLLITGLPGGGQFGKPGKGFMVTNTGVSGGGSGIVIDSTNVAIEGNQAVATGAAFIGIDTVDAGESILIEGNQAIGWYDGIRAQGANKTVRKNQASRNANFGIGASGASVVVGNVSTGNETGGIVLGGASSAVGNATYGNGFGFEVDSSFSGTIEKNNVFGNDFCGMTNAGAVGVNATNNYWGAATGPGPDPADQDCNDIGATTTVTPFATKPFNVKAPIKP